MSALNALRSLVLGASVAVAGLSVTRTSLLGYDVGPARGLDAEEAAVLLDTWAALPDVPIVTSELHYDTLLHRYVRIVKARPVVDFLAPSARADLRSVCERDGWTIEMWDDGSAVRRRLAGLRAALGPHNVRERTEHGRRRVQWTA